MMPPVFTADEMKDASPEQYPETGTPIPWVIRPLIGNFNQTGSRAWTRVVAAQADQFLLAFGLIAAPGSE